MVRIGLIGCGTVAEYGHAPAINHHPGLQFAALYDPSEERLAVLGRQAPDATKTTDVEEFFAQDLDAVAVCSPAWAHHANVMAAARHGLHVLCEKPIAMNEEEAHEMIAAMKKAKRIFGIGYCYRFSPVAMQLRDWIDEGLIGRVRSLRLVYIWNLHGRWTQDANEKWVESPLYRGRMEEGGPMVDCGVHQIDLARWWINSPIESWHGEGAWVNHDKYDAPDHVYAHLRHRDGTHTMVEMSFSYCHTARDPINHFSYHVIGDGGILRYDREGWRLEARHGQGTLTVPGDAEKNFAQMYGAFYDAIQTGKMGDLPTPEDGLIATQIAKQVTDQVMSRLPSALQR